MDSIEELKKQIEYYQNRYEEEVRINERLSGELKAKREEAEDFREISYKAGDRDSFHFMIIAALVVVLSVTMYKSSCASPGYDAMESYLNRCSKTDIELYISENYSVDEIYDVSVLYEWAEKRYEDYDFLYFSDRLELKEYILDYYDLEDIEEWYKEE